MHCAEIFQQLKVQAKEITATEGSIPGTLLLTPFSLIFDPNHNYPLCQENGIEEYVFYVRVEQIASISLYKEIFTPLNSFNEKKKPQLYEPHLEEDEMEEGIPDFKSPSKYARMEVKCLLPCYIAIRVLSSNEMRWFAVPRNQIDEIYRFLFEWLPGKYGEAVKRSPVKESKAEFAISYPSSDDRPIKEQLVPNSCMLKEEWEFASVSDLCGPFDEENDLVQVDLVFPDGANSSKILSEPMILQLLEILPARAQGYNWKKIFDTSKDGYHLFSLYRKMEEFGEFLSPILLVIKDDQANVFGSIVSEIMRPSNRFQGTADSCLLWRFIGALHPPVLRYFVSTGLNDHFYLATRNYLAFGVVSGRYALYLNEDLSWGSSEFTTTYQNESLAGQRRDFNIDSCEVFGFRD